MCEFGILTAEDVTNVMKKAAKWKGPGPDKLRNYWLKKFRSMHQYLAELINEVIEDPQRLPSFLTQGMTYLSPEDLQTMHDASKWAPDDLPAHDVRGDNIHHHSLH